MSAFVVSKGTVWRGITDIDINESGNMSNIPMCYLGNVLYWHGNSVTRVTD